MNTVNFSVDPLDVKENFDHNITCRVCLSNNICMSHIFDDKNKIIDKIEFCTGILLKEEEGIPTQICITCLKNLSIAHKFKTSCLLSEQIYQKILLEKVKLEIPNNNDRNIYINDCCDNKINIEREIRCDVIIKEENSGKDARINEPKVEVNEKSELKKQEAKVKTCGPHKKRGPYTKSSENKRIRIKKYKFRRLYCEICNIKFTNKKDSDAHKKDLHSDVNRICEFCGKVFLRYNSLYSHVRSHLPPDYACAHCDYSCNIKYDLVKHLRVHFGIKNYKCLKCNANFHTSSNLRDHERRLHTGERKRYTCTMCNKVFYDKTKLNRHIDSHIQIRRYTCDHCRSSFSRRCYWKKHMEKQHSVVIPPQRPGRQRVHEILGDHKKL